MAVSALELMSEAIDALMRADAARLERLAGQAPSIPLPRDVGPNQRTNSCRIRQRNVCEIKNQRSRLIGTQLGLEAKQIGKRQRPRKAPDPDSVSRPGDILDIQRLVRHEGDVNGE